MSIYCVINDGKQDCNIYALALLEKIAKDCSNEYGGLPTVRCIS